MRKKVARRRVVKRVKKRSTRRNPRVNHHMEGAVKMSTHVKSVVYDNRYSATPKRSYKHDFGAGVSMYALRDGSILLKGSKPLWSMFTVEDGE